MAPKEFGFVQTMFMIALFLVAVSLIGLILVQRGKGGGLAGAFGGMGGQSAFGTKAGDAFTKITVGLATFWILLCLMTVMVLGTGEGNRIDFGGDKPPADAESTEGAPDGGESDG